MKKTILLFASLLLCTFIFAQQIAPKSWLLQTDSAYNFSFKRPSEWTLKLPETNTRFFLTTPAENENDLFRENINCIVRVIEQKSFKISVAAEAIKKSLMEKLPDYKLIKAEYSTWNKAETLILEYTCTQKPGETNLAVHMQQRMAVVKGTLFTFTYVAEENSYNKFIGTVNTVFTSMKIK